MLVSKALFSSGEPVFAVDRNGQIAIWNPAAEQAFGYTEADAVGQYCWALLQGLDQFGNEYCCRGCPLRDMALHHKPIKSSEVYFKTASNKVKRFDVTMLAFHGGIGEELLVHLCRPRPADVRERSGSRRAIAGRRGAALTERELDVLSLLSQGKGTRDIAAEMCISTATVRNHTQHMLGKLHVHTRLEAVSLARRLGLV